MSVLFGRKTAGTRLDTINYARGLVVSLYIVSWSFSFIAAMLVQTNDFNIVSCTMSVYTCIILYACSKILIYLFLMEKVYVVTAVGTTRFNFTLYRVNLILLAPYLGILCLMLVYRVSELQGNGECKIGLLPPASVTLILYDVFISSWLTILFIRPLMSPTSQLQGPSKGKLRDVARRTLVGSLTALVLSTANVFTLVLFKGQERGLICLASCTVDVTLNAITVHWVTNRGSGRSGSAERRSGERRTQLTSHLTTFEKRVAPLESHISVTVESYVEQFHQQTSVGCTSSQ
ncbi:hypothetical protein BGX21_000399 [Mortierella sp. AD011]|nr:hypothetical protein BGX20_011446 [Mortierella sp. AD010]KAF9167985.1 hypothetical protein BGX20_011448 [Mortierella sp. AD010]KAF9388041.1 hypothetical protein BGX21_000397 [Mortierella sp. AD011]KAF9388043.1 hypothetical protein BGX21_000399 [Mortierella sp. AD011]